MTDTLSAFLIARIAEEEQAARAAMKAVAHADDRDGSARWTGTDDGLYAGANGPELIGPYGGTDSALTTHIARHDPARVLADCEAKRSVVELHAPSPVSGGLCAVCRVDPPCRTVRLHAQPDSGHPEFDPVWKLD